MVTLAGALARRCTALRGPAGRGRQARTRLEAPAGQSRVGPLEQQDLTLGEAMITAKVRSDVLT